MVLCTIWCTYVNSGWHDSAHNRTLPLMFLSAERYYLEYVLRFVKQCTSTYVRDFCYDPLKSHTRRIYSYLRVVPATEHPSLYSKWKPAFCWEGLLGPARPSWEGLVERTAWERLLAPRVSTNAISGFS